MISSAIPGVQGPPAPLPPIKPHVIAPQDMSIFGKLGLLLQNTADPSHLSRYMQGYEADQQRVQQETQRRALEEYARTASVPEQLRPIFQANPSLLAQWALDNDQHRRQQAEKEQERNALRQAMGLRGQALASYGADAPLSVRNNNPGNLRPVGASAGFQSFETPGEGLAAMERDLSAKIGGRSGAMAARFGEGYAPTLENVLATWAPPEENDTARYINFVSGRTGIQPGQVLSPGDIQAIVPAMVEMEGGRSALAHFGGQGDAPAPAQNPALASMAALAFEAPEKYGMAYLEAMSNAQNPEPSTDLGRMQRDEQMGFVPAGSTQTLVDQKNRSLRKEEAEMSKAEKAEQAAAEQEAVTRRVADTKLNEALSLLQSEREKMFGGNVAGIPASISLAMPGKNTDADRLNSIYSTLKSVISLDKLTEMKRSSPTGASGFGALSAPELQLLVDSVAALDVELPMDTQLKNLETISRILGYGSTSGGPVNWEDYF